MIEVLNLALPFFGLIFIGFACGKIKQIPDTALAWMDFFIVYVALPALFFRILSQTPLEQLAQVDFIFATTLSTFWAFALAFVVGLFSLIPIVGAFVSGVIMTLLGLTVSPTVALVALIYYLAYQQLESYVIYPRIMKRSVDIPGSVTVVAALVGGSLMGIVGALLAVPVAAALLLLHREVFLKRQDAH